MKRRIRNQKIRIRGHQGRIEFGGWLSGRQSYLRVQTIEPGIDWIEGRALYRLAKAIVTRYELADGTP